MDYGHVSSSDLLWQYGLSKLLPAYELQDYCWKSLFVLQIFSADCISNVWDINVLLLFKFVVKFGHFPSLSFPQLTKAQNNNSLHVQDHNNF